MKNKRTIEISIDDYEKNKNIFSQLNINPINNAEKNDQDENNQKKEDNLEPITSDDLYCIDNSTCTSTILKHEPSQDIDVSTKKELHSNSFLLQATLEPTLLKHEMSQDIVDNDVPLMMNTIDNNEEIKDDDLDLESDNDLNENDIDESCIPSSNSYQLNEINDNLIKLISSIEENKNYISQKQIKIISNDNYEYDNKIILNVGGKKFNLDRNILKHLDINYEKLYKMNDNNNNKIIYFLDKDQYYFSDIINIIKLYNFNNNKIKEHLNEYSEQLISELCYYNLLDKKFCPKPKLKLKKNVIFNNYDTKIIKIMIENEMFETFSTTILKSTLLKNKLKTLMNDKIFLDNIYAKIFRYILNFLRSGELYISNIEIIEYLNIYGIDYDKLDNKKNHDNIVPFYIPHDIEPVTNQILYMTNLLNPLDFYDNIKNIYYQFADNKEYFPNNLLVSNSAENINIITTESKLQFDSEIIFKLTNKYIGDCIDDILLCIDIPILKPTDNVEYVDMISYKIIENISLISVVDKTNKLLLQTNNEILYIRPLIYTSNGKIHHELVNIDNKRTKMIFDNTLIDIHRITIPLYLINDKKNNLPIKKLIEKNNMLFLIVKIASLNKLFKNKIKNIPLLNAVLIVNTINLANNILTFNNNNIINKEINIELREPLLYLYNKCHYHILEIQNLDNNIFDHVILPLDKFGLIKDFYFTIMNINDYNNGVMDKFMDDLIELEIVQIKNAHTYLLHSKMDAFLLNQYIPLKKLGHILPSGVYYYSFSSDPLKNQILGGLMGINFFIRIKVKKTNVIIKFFINEYCLELI